jgi:hypothetical protein
MKVLELVESSDKKTFQATFKLGRHSRNQTFNQDSITRCKAITPAEIRKLLTFDVGQTLITKYDSEEGRTIIYIERTK